MSNAGKHARADGGAAALPADEPGVRTDQALVDRAWLRIGAGCLIAGQAMVFSLAVNLSEIDGWAYGIVHGVLVAAALGALVFLGRDLMSSAWRSARERRVSIDLLFLVTLLGALGGSLVGTFTGTGSVYYEVVAVLIVVHTTGKMLGARSRLAALRAADATRERFEFCDVVREAGEEGAPRGEGGVMQTGVAVRRMRVTEVPPGAVARVAPGGAIAVDGRILRGRGFVRETSMTGEWRPVSRGPGDTVLAGTFSVDGSFDVRVEAAGGRRRLDGILSAVEQARLAPSVLQQQADRLMAWFLPLVVAVSAATFCGWMFFSSAPWERALFNAMAVLLVACPCAMGLATPVAVWGGLARLAAHGLVARTGDFLDALGRADFVCFDKTGTLSAESLRVREWRPAASWRGPSAGETARLAWLRAAVLAAEQGLAHPVAGAVRGEAESIREEATAGQSGALAQPGWVMELTGRRVVPGRGVIAAVRDADGVVVEIGVGERELQVECAAGLGGPPPVATAARTAPGGGADDVHRSKDEDGKVVFVFVDGELAAGIVLEEKWREGLTGAVEELRALGLESEVLTGDPSGDKAGLPLPVRAGLSPDEKARRVGQLAAAGRVVVFLGDGVNDASAMSAAHASIAMNGGAELARASAGAVFAGTDLRFLPRAVRTARATRRSVHWNLRFASCYNIAGMALAAAGWLHPVAAALLMLGSSAIVSVSALRGAR